MKTKNTAAGNQAGTVTTRNPEPVNADQIGAEYAPYRFTQKTQEAFDALEGKIAGSGNPYFFMCQDAALTEYLLQVIKNARTALGSPQLDGDPFAAGLQYYAMMCLSFKLEDYTDPFLFQQKMTNALLDVQETITDLNSFWNFLDEFIEGAPEKAVKITDASICSGLEKARARQDRMWARLNKKTG